MAKHSTLQVKGYDISDKSIAFASSYFRCNNLTYGVSDIRDVFVKHPQFTYFCMINSLFLLPDQDNILQKIHAGLLPDGMVFFIIPNIHGTNYLAFKKDCPQVNNMELTEADCIHYISSFGYTSVGVLPLCHANRYGRKELRYFSVLAPFYLRLLSGLMRMFNIGRPSYFLLAFRKNAA